MTLLDSINQYVKAKLSTSDFVAYHSSSVMGYDYHVKSASRFCFYSRKPRTFLDRSLGHPVWVITGKRDVTGKMIYRLAAVYTPDEIIERQDHCLIRGRRGQVFGNPAELNDLAWFKTLLRQQNQFSYGFNQIRDAKVIAALHALESGRRNTPARAVVKPPSRQRKEPKQPVRNPSSAQRTKPDGRVTKAISVRSRGLG